MAVEAHLNAILRCYTRETSVPVSAGQLSLTAGGSTATAVVQHASRTGLHLFNDVLVDGVAPAPEEPCVVRCLGSVEFLAHPTTPGRCTWTTASICAQLLQRMRPSSLGG
ncbi:hypothetical protein EV644_10218 [Kribbella orskensis]|uniref:PilZ domain-containing protein n=1 Tax=Kribbella orskensis TaxID=2512216 RepID=A0ABY2BQY7_9ACTN|nr:MULTISPECIES: hypothetical protein [Kribbella]TCN43342.1 hypothetical protein EV642_102719 [Kribbella sp. VKM Ac-2500]TCO29302.1 hypothetical protein EV644_10218 [Kribbella orskensis]